MSDDAPSGGDELEELVERMCPHCEQSWGLLEPPALSRLCEHGISKPPRRFADVARIGHLPDGRCTIILEESNDAQQTMVVLRQADAEALRVVLGRPGQSAMVERWRP